MVVSAISTQLHPLHVFDFCYLDSAFLIIKFEHSSLYCAMEYRERCTWVLDALVVLGAVGGAASYVAVALLSELGLDFDAVLVLHVVGAHLRSARSHSRSRC